MFPISKEKMMLLEWLGYGYFIGSIVALILFFVFDKKPKEETPPDKRDNPPLSDSQLSAIAKVTSEIISEPKIAISGIFKEIAQQEYDKKLWVQIARVHQRRQWELEKLLEENNIPFEKLSYSEAIEKAKQKVRF